MGLSLNILIKIKKIGDIERKESEIENKKETHEIELKRKIKEQISQKEIEILKKQQTNLRELSLYLYNKKF